MGSKQKYIFVTGGVLSGVGKGITAASIGAILQAKGVNVSIQKCDPYLNVDAGLLNPREHGECYVTKDGAETDLDLGHYERFLDIELTQKNATLAGRLLSQLIADERAGKFNGQTVQLVPHLTAAIKDAIIEAANGSDVHIIEIGGTVGDYEGLSFIEAIRDFASQVGRENCLYAHVVYVPFLETSKEFKSKPAQNALNDLRGFGIVPDCVVARTEKPAPDEISAKIARFSGLPKESVILLPNAKTVYEVPLAVNSSGIGAVLERFTGNANTPDLSKWKKLVEAQSASYSKTVTVGLIAKYLDNEDTYISVLEALKAASWQQGVNLNLKFINAEKLGAGVGVTSISAEAANRKALAGLDGIVVPGGFGARGIEGKIAAASYALKNNIPYLGLCLGLQVATIASARIGGLKNANSTEFNPQTKEDVVYIIEGQKGMESTGGTLRLGNYPAVLKKGSKIANLYGAERAIERHRHRYEVNQKFINNIEAGGLIISGLSPDKKLVEYVEAKNHPYFVATQAHPEFKSRPFQPHPLFSGLIEAAIRKNH